MISQVEVLGGQGGIIDPELSSIGELLAPGW